MDGRAVLHRSSKNEGAASQRTGKLLAGFVATIIIAAVPLWFVSHRDQEMQRLYAEAAAQPGYWHSSRESARAVRRLAGYSGHRSTQLLLQLALGARYSAAFSSEAQVEAIKALRDRKDDPEVPTALASLLQPHIGLDVREAAAQGLENLSCNKDCVQSVLHYLERSWHGELIDDYSLVPDPSGRNEIRKNQQKLERSLYSILRREKAATTIAVRDIYGIGSADPSLFGINLLSRIPFPEACPLLLQSSRQLAAWPPEFLREPRQALQTTIGSLNCK